MPQNGQTPELDRDPTKFELLTKGHLRLKAYPNIAITNTRTGRPLALSMMAGRPGGSQALLELGFADRTRVLKVRLPAQAATALQNNNKELGTIAGALTTEFVELEDLGGSRTKCQKGL